MRNPRHHALLAALLLLLDAGCAYAEALFASPPHFLALRDREQIVFFINETVAGALAARAADDSIEVVVPRAVVDPTLRGNVFRSTDTASGGTRVALAPGARGNATIRITTGTAPGGVHAYSEPDPPRLIVDLLAAAPQPTPTPLRTAGAATHAVATNVAPPRTVATRAPATAGAIDAAGETSAPTPIAAMGSGGVATAVAAPATAIRSTATAAQPTATRTRVPRATATRVPAAQATVRAEGVAPAPLTQPTTPHDLGALRSTVAVAAVNAGPDTSATEELPCAWRRVAGVAFCAADPGSPAYAADRELAALAAALAADSDPASIPAAPASDEPAALYLAADRELVSRAAGGRLLPAIDLYRRALRRAPGFFDAPRARLNMGLAYRTLGFDAELQSVAREAAADPMRALLDALVGDVAREHGAPERARDAYARAAAGGGAARCLAARGRAALALEASPPANAAAEVARLADLCPAALLADPETIRVQARQQLAGGDGRRALAMLTALQPAPGAGQEGIVLEDVALASAAAGDVAAARDAYTRLAAGTFGARIAARAVLALAHLDAAAGDVSAGFRRLDALAPATATAERRRFALEALTRALRAGAAQEAVTIVAEQGIAAATLAPEDQIRLARSYRSVGLVAEADALLRRVGDLLGKAAPDALWEERGRAALARDAAAQALGIGDEWLRTRGSDAPAAAAALRARALALLGQGAAAAQATKEAGTGLDPAAARALRLDVAAALRAVEPAIAARLAREALAEERAPALAAPEGAAALRTLADAAEASGDDAAALAAYHELTTRYADQPSAAGAAYRVARLTAGAAGGAAATAAYGEVARSRDPLERRVGTAAQTYETIVRPFENRREAP